MEDGDEDRTVVRVGITPPPTPGIDIPSIERMEVMAWKIQNKAT